jgi:acetyl-CoA synthetase
MLTPTDDYAALTRDFSWQVPEHYNIGVDVCDKWADGSGRLALIYEQADGHQTRYTFDDIRALSNRLANSLTKHGVAVGDRVGILLPQAPETAVSHVAAYKLGAIAVPLFTLFGVDALEYRLGNCAATALVTDREGLAKIRPIRHLLPALKTVYCVDGIAGAETAQTDDTGSTAVHAVLDFHAELATSSPAFLPRDSLADDPAVIIYTSGTTGKPKGALHAHRVLLGHLPGVEMSHNFFPDGASMMWTPADWAWIGGLLDVLMPSWHHGVPVLARRFEKFDASAAIELMARHKVTHTFLPPTALKLMRGKVDESVRPTLSLRSVASGGESLGEELIDWGRRVFGVTINEFYGQTECNMTVSSCSAMFAPQVGAIGKAVPGHAVAIVDEAGVPVAAGVEGNIGVRAPDPVMFLGYWNNPEATREKFAGEYLLTGDMGTCDEDGFIRFVGRNDDVITSAGYRIGPGPIEDCLMGHPAVRMAVVVGMPDAIRTEIVKAFIILHEGVTGDDALVKEIQAHVRTRLAAHEYPREIAFVDVLPMTATGKIIRRELRQLG